MTRVNGPQPHHSHGLDLTDEEYPHMAATVTEHYVQPDYRFGDEFDFGLNLILDALDASLSTH